MIRPIAAGNVFHRLASKVGCAAVTPSLTRQLSPTQIDVGINCACEAAVHAIRRYAIDHTESGQSHKSRLIVKLDLKNASNTGRRDHLVRVSSEHAFPITRLVHLAYSSPSTVLASGHLICSATGIQEGDPLGPVLSAMAVDEVACCCCRPHSTNVLPAESSTRNHVAASSLSPQVARKGSTLSGFVQRSRLEREVGRDLHSNKCEEV